jgi:hypothetical protein
MNIDTYKLLEQSLNADYKAKLHKLRLDYVKGLAKFREGEFVCNVTGIIKIEHIAYVMVSSTPTLIYAGYRYKKENGILTRTKDPHLSTISNTFLPVQI